MRQAAEILVEAVAATLAEGRRVLFAGDSFEVLQRLACADLRELVVVTPTADPSAPAGTTANGAVLRMRPDWRERPSSKDVVIDLTAEGAEPAAVARVLKKAGIYISLRETPAYLALPERHVCQARSSVALTIGAEVGQAVWIGEPTAEGPALYVAGKTLVELPVVAAILADVPSADSAEIDALESRIDALKRDMAAGQEDARALGVAQTELAQTQAALADAERQSVAALADLATLQAEHAEVEAEFIQVRDQLAEVRIDDARFERLQAKFKTARRGLQAEIESLQVRLRDTEQPGTDRAEALVERDAARAAFARATSALNEALAIVEPVWPSGGQPLADVTDELDGWLNDLLGGIRRGVAKQAATVDEATRTQAALRATEQQLREREADLALLKDAPAPAPTRTAPVVAASTDERVAALEAALAAERALRAAEQDERDRLRAAADLAAERAAAIGHSVLDARRDAARAGLAKVAAEESHRRLLAELDIARRRQADLEAMLAAHGRMERLLSEGLRKAQSDRDEATAARRLADENLRVLRIELERLEPKERDRSAVVKDRRRSEGEHAVRQDLATAQRHVAQLEEALRRADAERSVRLDPR